MLIAFANTKGGVSKSTLAAHLAIWLWDEGYPVALLDADEQQTSATWVRNAVPEMTIVTVVDMAGIQQARTELLKTHSIVVADTPGEASDAARTVTLLADLVIVPLQPSKPDVRAIKDTLTMIRLAQELTGGMRPQSMLVLTLVSKASIQSRLLRQQLVGSGLQVARTQIRRLNALRDSCDSAVTRSANPDAAAAASDIVALFQEVLGDCLSSTPRNRPPANSLREVGNG